MTAIWLIVRPLLPYIIGAVALFGGWVWLNHGWCNAKCESATERAETAESLYAAAVKRTTDITMMFTKKGEEADAAARAARNARAQQGSALVQSARSLSHAPTVVLSGDARRVFDDASLLANSAPAPVRDSPPAVAVPDVSISEAQLAAAWADAAIAYADAKSLHLACVNFYNELRNTLPQ